MSTREKSALYPNATWNDCIEFVRTIDAFKLKSVSYLEVAKKYGLSSASTKSFTAKLSSCKQFGLITTSGGNTIQLTETCKRLLYPTGGSVRSVEIACFIMPPLYNKLIAAYDGKALPSIEILGNILMNEHSIARAVKDAAAKCFIQSAEQLGLIQGGVLNYSDSDQVEQEMPSAEQNIVESENVPQQAVAIPIMSSTRSFAEDVDYISQSYPVSSGKMARISIPIDSTEDDLLLIRDMFDVLLKRKFKIKI